MKNENVNAIEEVKVNEEISESVKVVEEEKDSKLFLERGKFISNGIEYFNYFVKGQVRGRDIKVDFIPKDKGGFEVLDLVFGTADKVNLIIAFESMTDSKGVKTRYNTYKAQLIEDDMVYECSVKPSRDSDKALLKMLLCRYGIKLV